MTDQDEKGTLPWPTTRPKPVYSKDGNLIATDFSQRQGLYPPPEEDAEQKAFIPPLNSEALERRIRERFGENIDYDPKPNGARYRIHEALRDVVCLDTHLSFPELAKEQQQGPNEIKRKFEASAIQSCDDTTLPKYRYPLPKIQSFIGKGAQEQTDQLTPKPLDLIHLYFFDDTIYGTTVYANLAFSHLESSTVHSTKFQNCSMLKTKVDHAFITDSQFVNCQNMTYMQWTNGTEIKDCDFKGKCDLSFSTMKDVVLDGVTFSPACDLRGMTFEAVTVRNMDFTKMTRQQKIALCSAGIIYELDSCKIPSDMYKVLVKKGFIKAPLQIEDHSTKEPMAIANDGQATRMETGLSEPPDTVVHVSMERLIPDADHLRTRRVAAAEINRISGAESPKMKEERDRAIQEGTVVDLSQERSSRS